MWIELSKKKKKNYVKKSINLEIYHLFLYQVFFIAAIDFFEEEKYEFALRLMVEKKNLHHHIKSTYYKYIFFKNSRISMKFNINDWILIETLSFKEIKTWGYYDFTI